eukprot:352753-Chlamydomonas_euryale.AAC.8
MPCSTSLPIASDTGGRCIKPHQTIASYTCGRCIKHLRTRPFTADWEGKPGTADICEGERRAAHRSWIDPAHEPGRPSYPALNIDAHQGVESCDGLMEAIVYARCRRRSRGI